MFLFTGSRQSAAARCRRAPRASITASARYGFAAGSGMRSSTRVERAARGRDAHHRRAVALLPRDVHRRLVARHQPLVRVDQRVRDRAHAARVLAAARRCSAARSRQLPLAFGSQNAFSPPLNSDWCVCMPAPFCPKIGFGMNDASSPNSLRDALHHEAERARCCRPSSARRRSGSRSRAGRARPRGAPPRPRSPSARACPPSRAAHPRPGPRREVEVAADVVRVVVGAAVGVALEQEELRFHARRSSCSPASAASAISRLSAPRGSPANGVPSGVVMSQISRADARRSRRPTETPRTSTRSGCEEHVRLLDAHEPLDRRAVEHDVAVQRLLELLTRDLDVLSCP